MSEKPQPANEEQIDVAPTARSFPIITPSMTTIKTEGGFMGVVRKVIGVESSLLGEEEPLSMYSLSPREWGLLLIDHTEGLKFEELVQNMLDAQGYDADVTQASGDLGVDILAIKDGIRYAIQVNRQSTPVSRQAVSDAVAGLKRSSELGKNRNTCKKNSRLQLS